MTPTEAKELLAIRVLMSDHIRNLGRTTEDRNVLHELVSKYHLMDPKAWGGAHHVEDFIKNHHIGDREFQILLALCNREPFNIVLLMRAEQLGIISFDDLTGNFWIGQEMSRPFNFDELYQNIVVVRKVQLIKP